MEITPPQKPAHAVVRRAWLFSGVLVATFVGFRLFLHAAPNTDFNVGGYNIHHLFTGILVLTAFGLPLVLQRPTGRWGDLCLAGFAFGLSLVLDEWVYLIATDGSNAAYLTPISLWGGALLIGLTAAAALLCAFFSKRR